MYFVALGWELCFELGAPDHRVELFGTELGAPL